MHPCACCATRAPGVGKLVVASRNKPHGALAVAAPIIFLALMLAGWWLSTTLTGIEAWRLPTPQSVVIKGRLVLALPMTWERVRITGAEAIAGCLLGSAVALPSAYAIYRSRLLAAAVEPFLGATQALPAIAIAPILVLWVGYGFVAIVVLCALMVFFPILVSTVVGLRHIDRELLEAAALDGATGWSMAWHMELPLAAPAILGGLRNGFALSVTGAVVGEMVMGGTGLGQVLTQMRNNVDTAGMFVIIIILCTMATLLYTIVYRIERSKRYDITQ